MNEPVFIENIKHAMTLVMEAETPQIDGKIVCDVDGSYILGEIIAVEHARIEDSPGGFTLSGEVYLTEDENRRKYFGVFIENRKEVNLELLHDIRQAAKSALLQ